MLTDILTINQTTATNMVDHALANRRNLLLIGGAGTGKTAICLQRPEKFNSRSIYLNLSTLEAPDLLGLMEKTVGRKTTYCIPEKFSYASEIENPDEWPTLIVDELDKARPELQNPMLELFQFRSLNGTKLAIRTVLATANRPDENAFSRAMSHALTNRCSVYVMNCEFDPWQEWAVSAKVNPLIVGFLSRNPNKLNCPPPSGDETAYLHGSPRSWSEAALDLDSALDKDVDYQTLLVAGRVGGGAATEFKVWLEHYRHIQPVIDALVNNGTHPSREDVEGAGLERLFVLSIAGVNAIVQMAAKADAKKAAIHDVKRVTKNVMSWVGTIPPEYQIGAVKSVLSMDMIRNYKLVEDPEFLKVFIGIRRAWEPERR